tara:strand:- start:3579 stop:4517 length:939 start_codon:yes stop_codon:yes gene_type:complete
MKKIIVFFVIFLFSLNIAKAYAEDSLTLKQQMDRITQEIKDLNRAVFNKSFEGNNINLPSENDDIERFTSIDIRIYDLEKDIKNLTLQFEEILFKIDDLSQNLTSIENNFNDKINNLNLKTEVSNLPNSLEQKTLDTSEIEQDNTLGTLVISDSKNENTSGIEESTSINQNNQTTEEKETIKLSAEEKLQLALDLMMKKDYEESKKTLENFINDYPNNQLAGSAHFWLGKIYLFETNYRKAAIIFGEGVQKFPKSIKTPEMYYELSKSLIEMNKNSEACKTLLILNKNFKNNKFSKDPEKISQKLDCENSNS